MKRIQCVARKTCLLLDVAGTNGAEFAQKSYPQ